MARPRAGKGSTGAERASSDKDRSSRAAAARERVESRDFTGALAILAPLSAFVEFARTSQGSKVWPALEAWFELPPDPRVAHVAVSLLASVGGVRDMTPKVWRRLVNCVEVHGHVGLLEELARARESLGTREGWGFSGERLANLAKKLQRSRAPVEVEGARGVLEALPAPAVDRARKHEVSAIDLVAAIVADPAADGPRLVYADWLAERGDPRGEFITLQIRRAAGEATDAERAREATLLRKHRMEFLGPLRAAVRLGDVRFERGFVASATLRRHLPPVPEAELVEDIDFGGLVIHATAALRSVRGVNPVTLRVQRPDASPLGPGCVPQGPLDRASYRVVGRAADVTRVSEELRRFEFARELTIVDAKSTP